jgi:hypothetical protein
MNQLLFERSTGFLSSHAFARKQSTRLLHDIQLNPRCRFRGEDEPLAAEAVAEAEPTSAANEDSNYERKTYAHRSGVNALVAEQFDRRLCVPSCDSSEKPSILMCYQAGIRRCRWLDQTLGRSEVQHPARRNNKP